MRSKPKGCAPRPSPPTPHEHLRTICSREVSYIRNGKEVRYHFKKAGQKVSVKPRMAANDNTGGGLGAPIYRIVR